MIVKGKAQGGAAKLARHLARTDQNERVRVIDSDGINALTIRDALRELDDLGLAADTKRTLYHGILAPKVGEGLTEDQRIFAVRRMAEKMGLATQAYVVVGHIKPGEEEHFHIVWSRIDQERQAGISDSHNYRKHEELAQELNQEFGFAQVRGVHTRDKSNEPRPGRTPDHWEMQQQHRTGQTVAEARRTVTEAWRVTKTGAEFIDALSQAGFTVARGDRRDFVLVDEAGGIHGLSRRIEGAKAKDIRERMTDVDLEQLEDVHQARRRQRELRQAAELEKAAVVLSAAERLRNEELEREREARGNRPRLNEADREAAAAVRMLQILGTQTHVVGRPVAARRQERPEPARVEPPAAPAAQMPAAPPATAPAKRESIMEKLDREARERGDAPIVVKFENDQTRKRERLMEYLPRSWKRTEDHEP